MVAKEKITEKTLLGDIISKYPKAAEKLFQMGLMCVMCGMAQNETLEQGAIAHGLDPKKVAKELNKVIK